MTTFSKHILSTSVNGRAIKVSAIATPGTLIHTGSVTGTTLHEVWLYATNSDSLPHKLTIEYGSVTSPDDNIILNVPSRSGLELVIPGLLIVGNVTPLLIRGFSDLTNVISIHGYVNEIA